MNNILLKIGAGLFICGLAYLIFRGLSGKNDKAYTDAEVGKIIEKQIADSLAYEDSLSFVDGQLELQAGANAAKTERIISLERAFDSLKRKHDATAKKIRPMLDTSGISAMLVPNEYVDECEKCWNMHETYIKENQQLRFERDSYDSLMRIQNNLNENRIKEVEGERLIFNKMFNDCSLKLASKNNSTRKLKLSAMGQLNDLFLPKGGGAGVIYEDKKSNEYGGHVIFTDRGKMYLFNIARTISFKRNK